MLGKMLPQGSLIDYAFQRIQGVLGPAVTLNCLF